MASYWQRIIDVKGKSEALRYIDKRIRQATRLITKKGKTQKEVNKYKIVVSNLKSWKEKISQK